MKTRFASALLFSVVILASCNQAKDEQAEKIASLEEKIASLEGGNIVGTTNADPSTLGAFQFTEMEFDFGTINEGKVVEKIFNFTNNGQAPLVISNITATCGCTSPEWTKTPVQPGEKGFVKVVFDSKAKSGAQNPTVTIQANTNPSVTKLSLKGTVTSSGTAQTGPVIR